MTPETTKRLHDAIGACREIGQFTRGRSRDAYLADRAMQLVIWKLTEIAGETLRRAELADPGLARSIPELRDVVNTRNRITHGYDSVDVGLLWDIAETDIPVLQQRREIILG